MFSPFCQGNLKMQATQKGLHESQLVKSPRVQSQFCFHTSDLSTPQPLYNTTVGVPANFCVSCPNHVISRVKCIGYIG